MIQRLCAAHLSLDVCEMQHLPHCMVHWLELSCLFFHSAMTVFGLMGNTRAVSRIPLAFMALSTICCLTSGD